MQDSTALSPKEHLDLLRQALGQIQRITKSVRREPKDTHILAAAEAASRAHLEALERWVGQLDG